ncbi:MAG: hypothetical protein E7680_04695 [Ruminococcaceae bacterium]|nr:hypothetical protein [Oscillospiraceae bacterium]
MKNETQKTTNATDAADAADAAKKKPKTALRRQTIAAIVLAGVLVILIAAQIVASGLIRIYTLKDTFLDENGVLQTVKYTVKRDSATGLYALYNERGEKMTSAPDNGYNNYEVNGQKIVVYETEVGGNQYRVNTATGEFSLYASVDPEGDEVRGGTATNTRLLMFARVDQSDILSLQVENASGKYRTENKNGSTVLSVWDGEDWQESAIPPDQQAYANLAVNCGYTLTMQKLDLTAPGAPRLADGEINYAAYGLDPNADENRPASYILTVSGGKSYTVLVGNLAVTGEGYYIKRADRDAVYLADTGVSVLHLPVEKLVSPMAFYPLGETTYPMVENFFLWKVGHYDSENEQADSQIVTAFGYRDLALREYTLYQTTPYVIPEQIEFLNGYSINDWEISELLSRLYCVQYLSCEKFMPELEDLEAVGLTENFHYLIFDFPVATDTDGSKIYVRNTIFISQKIYSEKLGQEVCYLYSPAPAETDDPSVFTWGYDMIVAVDPYYFSFIEWEQSRWYSPYYFQTDLSYLRELHLTFGEKQYDFYLDNSKSSQKDGISAENLEVICPQYPSSDHKLDYQEQLIETSDTGKTTVTDYTGVRNFKRLISKLFMGTIEGDVDCAQFEEQTGKTVEQFIADDVDDNLCIAKIRYHLEDYADEYNSYWQGNNRRDIVLRFYEYEPSGRKCLLTVEVLERDDEGNLLTDEDGEPLTDPTRATGLFYVNSASLGVFAGYTEDLLNKVLIPN